MQNIILAFAGRVLLRKADIRFQRGHRYGTPRTCDSPITTPSSTVMRHACIPLPTWALPFGSVALQLNRRRSVAGVF